MAYTVTLRNFKPPNRLHELIILRSANFFTTWEHEHRCLHTVREKHGICLVNVYLARRMREINRVEKEPGSHNIQMHIGLGRKTLKTHLYWFGGASRVDA